eukprot:352208_1
MSQLYLSHCFQVYGNGQNKGKPWKWYYQDEQRLGLLVTPDERVLCDIVEDEFKSNGLNWNESATEVINYVSSKIRYVSKYSGKALTPLESLARGKGVCLEYANIALTLLWILDKRNKNKFANYNFVFVGINRTTGTYHAWIGHYNEANKKFHFREPQNANKTHNQIYNKYAPLYAYNSGEYWAFSPSKDVVDILSKSDPLVSDWE